MSHYVVTGAAGFIGSQILKRLIEDGVPSNSLVAVDTDRALFDSRICTQTFRTLRFLDHKTFQREFESGALSVHTLYHMGACSSTDETRQEYLDEVNLNYSKALWQASVRHKTKFIYASSGATYGDGNLGFSDDPQMIPRLQPLNLYGWSKQNFDLFVLDEVKNLKAPPIWSGLKFFNVYGPGEEHKGGQASVIFHAYQQIKKSGSLKLFQSHKSGIADGEQKRDFVYVGDCVAVALSCAVGLVKNGIYNVGSGSARSFLDLGRAVFKAMNKNASIEFIPTPEKLRSHYQYYTCADLSRLRGAGFTQPMTSLEEGVDLYVRYLVEQES